MKQIKAPTELLEDQIRDLYSVEEQVAAERERMSRQERDFLCRVSDRILGALEEGALL